jgi:hypothetical protein
MNKERVIIEGLRSGVPFRETAQAFTVGRTHNLTIIGRLMEAVEQGRQTPAQGMIIRAQYGEGKTHLLHALAAMAEERNWLVSMLTLSKETPLDRLDYVYPKIMQNVYRPGSHQPGFEAVIREALRAPHLVPDSRLLQASDRVHAVLDNLIHQDNGFEALLDDVSGNFVTLADIKRFTRDNFSRRLPIASSRIKDEIPHYFQLVNWLIAHTEYEGLLILFDEVELIGKFGRGGRARSYVNMGRFLKGIGDHLLSIWAVAGNFQTDVILPRKDHEVIEQWLSSRPKEAEGVAWSNAALDELSSARPLDPLTPEQIRDMLGEIAALHQIAYAWDCGLDGAAFYQLVREHMDVLDARLRTWIRMAISLLDMRWQFGDGASVKAHDIEEVDLSEDRSYEEAPDADEDSEHPWRSH